ncbi:hypothetical protein TNCV_2383491 [Trichonephila clavipes]|nr:hypothetical protein TNCV_2383491 [Trichonephila clavipes]
MKTSCLKCGENHRTGMCEIKDKIEDPLCINCKAKGHMASSTQCPLFPTPRKGNPHLVSPSNRASDFCSSYQGFIDKADSTLV